MYSMSIIGGKVQAIEDEGKYFFRVSYRRTETMHSEMMLVTPFRQLQGFGFVPFAQFSQSALQNILIKILTLEMMTGLMSKTLINII